MLVTPPQGSLASQSPLIDRFQVSEERLCSKNKLGLGVVVMPLILEPEAGGSPNAKPVWST